MAFSFSSVGGAQAPVEQLAEQNEQSSGGIMPPQKNNLFLIERVEVKEKSSGAVQVDFMFNCVGEKYANRKVFNSINVVKTDGTLNEIGERQIGALAHAVGHIGIVDDPEMLLQYNGVQFCADVKIEKGQKGYEDRNVLANWKQNKGQAFQELAMPAQKSQSAPSFKPQGQTGAGWANAQQPVKQANQQPAYQQPNQAMLQQATTQTFQQPQQPAQGGALPAWAK